MSTYSFLDVNATLVGAGAVIDLGAGAATADITPPVGIQLAGSRSSPGVRHGSPNPSTVRSATTRSR